MSQGFVWSTPISFFKEVSNPFLLQWKHSWDHNIKFLFLSSVMLQLPEFLFSVCSVYSLSCDALEALCGFMDSWIIIPFSQHSSDGPRLPTHKALPQCPPYLVKDQSPAVMWVQKMQHKSILESLAEARFKCTSSWRFRNLRMSVQQ